LWPQQRSIEDVLCSQTIGRIFRCQKCNYIPYPDWTSRFLRPPSEEEEFSTYRDAQQLSIRRRHATNELRRFRGLYCARE
jgi:hypothetical protein